MTETTETTTTLDEAVELLVAEGYERADVETFASQLCEAGFELDQPDEGHILTDAEVAVLRDQLTVSVPADETWTVIYSGHDGQHRQEGFTSKDAAREWASLALTGGMRVVRYECAGFDFHQS